MVLCWVRGLRGGGGLALACLAYKLTGAPPFPPEGWIDLREKNPPHELGFRYPIF